MLATYIHKREYATENIQTKQFDASAEPLPLRSLSLFRFFSDENNIFNAFDCEVNKQQQNSAIIFLYK